jgi:hypothetical protein
MAVAVRAHTERMLQEKKYGFKPKKDLRLPYGQRVLVLDTETTTNTLQNLLCGQAIIYEGTGQASIDGLQQEHYIFYADGLNDEQMKMITQYAGDKGAVLLTRERFVTEVFYPELITLGTVCVCFNAPFDLSRLATSVKVFEHGKYKDYFELTLSDDRRCPAILIKPIDSKKAFISLRPPTRPKSGYDKRNPFHQGRFIDLRTLVFALTNESHSLLSAGKLYKARIIKTEVEQEHGSLTPDYLEYNYRDVQATFELYCKAKEEFDKHPIKGTDGQPLKAGKAYSPASIGKAYYEAMGVRPLKDKEVILPAGMTRNELLGYAMTAFYAGRSECHFRNTPEYVYHTDITSMYPSVFVLQNLWQLIIAEKYEVVEATEEIKQLLEGIAIEALFDKGIWLKMPGLVQILPHDDLLPIRAEYGQGNGYQIGLNYLDTSKLPKGKQAMWYTLADVVACKILTGKTPEIIRAYRILPIGVQPDLTKVKLQGKIEVEPASEDFFKKVIEERAKIKTQIKTLPEGDGRYEPLNSLQQFLKILANSTSYGIFIEMNREEKDKEEEIAVYGLDDFSFEHNQVDILGKFYNPLVAIMITGAAHLILAMMEKTCQDLGGTFAFCDTDSMSIIDLKKHKPETIGKQVVDKFKSLWPYEGDSSLLAAEEYNWERIDWNKENVKSGQYHPLYCYMISAKRYVLYNLIPDGNGGTKIIIRKKSDHGLGHLMSPVRGDKQTDWINEVWKYHISREHGQQKQYQEPDWFNQPAFARLAISKPSIYKLLNRDRNKPYGEQVKPFNFLRVAYPVERLFSSAHIIKRYYCRKHKAVGRGACNYKGQCPHSSTCFASLHIIPITPFGDDKGIDDWNELPWYDKTTKEPVKIKINRPQQELDLEDMIIPADGEDAIITIKTYFDFIKGYHLHPELKYDGKDGQNCGKGTKGLLQRTHVMATRVKHIGKETNTLHDDEAGEGAALPDELNVEIDILQYEQTEKARHGKPKIDEGQWQELILILKQKARPQKDWAEKLEITLDYFKQMLAGKRNPAPELYDKILKLCKEQGLSIPSGKIPCPRAMEVERQKEIYPLSVCSQNFLSLQAAKEVLPGQIFELYGTDYINLGEKPARDFLDKWKMKQEAKQKSKEAAELRDLKVRGICLTDGKHELEEFLPGDIAAYQVCQQGGYSYKELRVRLNNGHIYRVLVKDNPLAFRFGLLQKPSRVECKPDSADVKEKNGYRTKYWSFILYERLPWLSEMQVLRLYGESRQQVDADLKRMNIPINDAVRHDNGKLMFNPVMMHRLYHEDR